MKKALYGFAAAAIVSSTALAGGPDMHVPMTQFRPFVGVNYSYLDVSNSDALGAVGTQGNWNGDARSFNGIGFLAGLKYGHYLGFVWGWNHYFSEKNNGTPGNTAVSFRPENMYFDVRGYYPVMSQFDLIGSVGADLFDAGALSAAAVANDTQVNLRLGVGADYYFTPNWGVEAMFNYVPFHNPGAVELSSFWTINVGINYMFS